jgi:hypothetical protein
MFSIVGARRVELGDVFVVTHESNKRERMFLMEGFDLPAVERKSLWLTLHDKEQARTKVKLKREIGEANMLHARAAAVAEADDEAVEDEADEILELQVATFDREYEPEITGDEPEEKDTESIVEPEQIAAD